MASRERSAGLAVLAALFALCLAIVGQRESRGDTLYVADTGQTGPSGSIWKFDSSGVGTVFASGLRQPEGLAFDSGGNLYVACINDSNILKYTSSGVSTVFASVGLGVDALAFDSTGNLYAANRQSNTITKYNSSGVGVVFANTGLSQPDGLAFDTSGNLYAANRGNSTIERFDASGVGTVFAGLSGGIAGPVGLAFDTSGNLYVANEFTFEINKINPSGAISKFSYSNLGEPCGLAFDSAGFLYTADFAGGIGRINTAGVYAVFASWMTNPGLREPFALAFQPVPEPSTWALVALGLLLTMVGHRRVRRTS